MIVKKSFIPLVLFLQCFAVNLAHAGAQLVKIQGRLIYNGTGKISRPINDEPLWNTFIGEGFAESPSDQLLIELVFKGTPNSSHFETLFFQVPYQSRKAVLPSEDSVKSRAAQNKVESIIEKYIDVCCHTHEEYQKMLTQLSQTERIELNKQQQRIDAIDKKDKQLLTQGFETKYHMNEQVHSVTIGEKGTGVLWFVVSNSGCAIVNVQAKFEKSPTWSKKTFHLECGE